MAAHRHWRLYVDATNGALSGFTRLAELEMYEAAFGPNVCAGGTPSASSGTAADGFDADLRDGGAWAAATDEDEWLAYDFGAGNEKEIVALGIICSRQEPFAAPKDFRLQFSDNGVDWTDFFTVEGETTWSIFEHRLFVHPSHEPSLGANSDRGSHLYWRVWGCCGFHSLAEVEMRATSGGGDQCTGGTPTAASSGFGTSADDAVDDNPSTHWNSADSTRTWWKYEFAAPVEVYELSLQARGGGFGDQAPDEFVLQYSDDDSVWTTAWSEHGQAGWSDLETRIFTDPEAYVVAFAASGPITPNPADAGADTVFLPAGTIRPAPADAGAETVGPAVPPVTPSVISVTGDPDELIITGSSYASPIGTPQQYARWQIVVDGGDPDDPGDLLYDSGYSDTDFESHPAEDTGIDFGINVDVYVTHVDTNGLEARSGPFDHTITTVGKLGGMLIEFIESDGATVVESFTEHTDQTTFTELIRENLLRPAGSKYLRIRPHKIGTEAKAGTIQRVSADRGEMAIAHHARPYMPDLDDFFVHGAVSASSTIDWSRGRFQTIDLDANLVATHLNARVGQEIELLLTQDGTGGRTIDLGATGEPTYSTAANAVDHVTIRKTATSTYIVVAEKLGIS